MYTETQNWCGVSAAEFASREKARRRAVARANRAAYRAMIENSAEIIPADPRYDVETRPDGTQVYAVYRDGQTINLPFVGILRARP